jgi:hypothetical protein
MMHRRRIWRHSQSWFFPFSPWATNAHADTSGPSANAAATSRGAAAATQGTASLALVPRSLALEWPSMGLGSRRWRW